MEKLRSLRKQRGISQEKIANAIATDPSNYSRKERGEVRIYDDEWEKLAKFLEVPVEDIKEDANAGMIQHNDNLTFHDHSANNYTQYSNIPTSIIENLQSFIKVLMEQNEDLKEENQKLKSKIEG